MTDEPQTLEHGGNKKRELLTDREAAERMGWSKQKIQRLRLTGQLPFYPGRPPLIEPADLEKLKIRRVTPEVTTESAPSAAPAPHSLAPSTLAAEIEKAKQLARRKWLRMRHNFPR